MSAERVSGDLPIGPIRGPLPNAPGQNLEELSKNNELYLSFKARIGSIRERGELPPHLSSKEDLEKYISDLSETIKMLLAGGEPNAAEQADRLSGLLDIAREHYREF